MSPSSLSQIPNQTDTGPLSLGIVKPHLFVGPDEDISQRLQRRKSATTLKEKIVEEKMVVNFDSALVQLLQEVKGGREGTREETVWSQPPGQISTSTRYESSRIGFGNLQRRGNISDPNWKPVTHCQPLQPDAG